MNNSEVHIRGSTVEATAKNKSRMQMNSAYVLIGTAASENNSAV